MQSECLVPAVPKWQDLQPGGKPAYQAERLAVIDRWSMSLVQASFLCSVPVRVSRCRVHGAMLVAECPCEAEQQHWGRRCGTLAQGVAHVCHMSCAML